MAAFDKSCLVGAHLSTKRTLSPQKACSSGSLKGGVPLAKCLLHVGDPTLTMTPGPDLPLTRSVCHKRLSLVRECDDGAKSSKNLRDSIELFAFAPGFPPIIYFNGSYQIAIAALLTLQNQGFTPPSCSSSPAGRTSPDATHLGIEPVSGRERPQLRPWTMCRSASSRARWRERRPRASPTRALDGWEALCGIRRA